MWMTRITAARAHIEYTFNMRWHTLYFNILSNSYYFEIPTNLSLLFGGTDSRKKYYPDLFGVGNGERKCVYLVRYPGALTARLV